MSELRAIVHPGLVAGFQLAGVETYSAEDVETAEELITGWLDAGDTCLLAIDDTLLAHVNPAVMKRLEASSDLLIIGIPSSARAGIGVTRGERIARMIRRSIGVHITFGNENLRRDT